MYNVKGFDKSGRWRAVASTRARWSLKKECRGEDDNGSSGGPLLRSCRGLVNRERLGIHALKYSAWLRKERNSVFVLGTGMSERSSFLR